MGLRFWTAPAYLKYSLKINSLIIPGITALIFLADHLDVMLLGCVVLLMNFYVFWYHMDPPRTDYAGGKYTTRNRDYDSDDSDDSDDYRRN